MAITMLRRVGCDRGCIGMDPQRLGGRAPVPVRAAFVEETEGGEGALTDAQRKFLDKFSSGLAETISKEANEADAKGDEDRGTA